MCSSVSNSVTIDLTWYHVKQLEKKLNSIFIEASPWLIMTFKELFSNNSTIPLMMAMMVIIIIVIAIIIIIIIFMIIVAGSFQYSTVRSISVLHFSE